MYKPLVSIICLCYNHEHFVTEALESVLTQTYSNLQIIIVDDASQDASVHIINKIVQHNPSIQFVALSQNVGLCKAFNKGLALAKGNFIVDFATDDIMLSDRIQQQIDFFESLDDSYGVVFTDGCYVDAAGNFIRNHFEHLFKKGLLTKIPEGDIYADVLSTYFILSPTMLVRREVFDKLGGYDETLSYEDFDFWVRSSRIFKYAFLDKKLTKVRRTQKSMSTGWYRRGDPQLYSTYLVCKKAKKLNRTNEDEKGLLKRVRYELRQSIFSENVNESKLFYELLIDLSGLRLIDRLIYCLNKIPLPLSKIRMVYHRLRFGIFR